VNVFTPEFKAAVREKAVATWDATKRVVAAAYAWIKAKTKRKETGNGRNE
jgi:hypothetical protein